MEKGFVVCGQWKMWLDRQRISKASFRSNRQIDSIRNGDYIVFESIDVKNGKITFCDIGDYLKEDLFQVIYPNDVIVDVGWYNGVHGFIIAVISSFDWENPIIKYVVCDETKMLLVLQKVIDKIAEN